MSVTRVPQFPESVLRRGQTNARSDLDVYSKNEVDVAISGATAGIDLSAYTPLTTTASISGDLAIDISNLDVSLTQAIVDYVVVDGSTPSVTGSFFAWGKIEGVVSGAPYWIQLFK